MLQNLATLLQSYLPQKRASFCVCEIGFLWRLTQNATLVKQENSCLREWHLVLETKINHLHVGEKAAKNASDSCENWSCFVIQKRLFIVS